MARDDKGIVGQREQLLMDGAQDLFAVSARQVRASDAVAKQRVSGYHFVLLRNTQADAALRMAGGVEDVELGRAGAQRIALTRESVDFRSFRRGHAEPLRLHVKM